ncbi:hypothetical protein SIN8267_01556 [Sinobacterium norvegicum]|uniref:DUF4136 domain-containing protein n=1 Tax=Sinobacterium norvegicum TaxID=1641715 RepID=A0ABN8EID7_9GAMM|nr:DUF4136 domain-containing protein [Sinobacterium norvegicum]CAH0991450.1 hypothetical protein SIN8267_01556 [Sinobacterium norvegicum]
MKSVQRLLLATSVLIAVVAISACSGVKTKSYTHSKAVIGDWQSYNWRSEAMVPKEGVEQRTIDFDHWIRAAVDKKLQEKGYVYAAENADISLDYRFGEESFISEDGLASPRDYMETAHLTSADYNAVNSQFYNHPVMTDFQIKGIVFSVLDNSTKRMVWEGVAKKLVEDNSPSLKAVESSVQTGINKLFRDLPNAGEQ